jgi:subtilisin family serine protease
VLHRRTRRYARTVALALVLALAVGVSPVSVSASVDATAPLEPGPAVAPPLAPPDTGEVIVGVETTGAMRSARAAIEALGGEVTGRYAWNAYDVAVPAGVATDTFCAALESGSSAVRYAHVPGTVQAAGVVVRTSTPSGAIVPAFTPDDAHFADQWGLAKVGAPRAWDVARGDGVTIAIIDTGVDSTHPDLAGKVAGGRSWVTPDTSDFADDNGHGTFVAGIAAAATNNAIGVAGAAPGARLLIAKVLDSGGSGQTPAAASAVRWAADNGAKVISMSFTATDLPAPNELSDACAYASGKGCILVAAGGNTFDGSRVFPAAYDGVLGVGATDVSDVVPAFSSRGTRLDGSPTVVLGAPGEDVISTYPGGGYAWMTGTSAGAPLVAGAAAVVWSRYSSETSTAITERLTTTALDIDAPGRDTASGWGRLRMDAAVSPSAAEVVRIGGRTAYDTAAAGAARSFPGFAGVTDVVIVSGESRSVSDALAAAGLAAAYRGPLLLTRARTLSPAVRAALNALPAAARVHIVGGRLAVSRAVERALARHPKVAGVDRVGGADRYATAALVARRMRSVRVGRGIPAADTALVACASSAARTWDAAGLAAISAATGYPVLYVRRTSVPASTRAALRSLGLANVYVAGDARGVSAKVFRSLGARERWAGSSTYATSYAVASAAVGKGWLMRGVVGVAPATPDAAVGAALAGREGGALLLVPRRSLGGPASAFLAGSRGLAGTAYVVGSWSVLSGTVGWQVGSALN